MGSNIREDFWRKWDYTLSVLLVLYTLEIIDDYRWDSKTEEWEIT